MKSQFIFSIIFLSCFAIAFADPNEKNLDPLIAEYSESIYFVNVQCGNDSWRGLSPVCTSPNGPKKTIQAAINTAEPEDLIMIYPGTYHENLIIDSKNLALIGTNPYDSNIIANTIIDGNNFGNSIRTVNSDCLFKGLTIRRGYGLKGGGIYSSGGYLKVKKCIILDNKTVGGYGIVGGPQEGPIEGFDAGLLDFDDPNGGDGGGIYCDNALIEDCNVSNNSTGSGYADDNADIYGKGGNGAAIYCNGQVNINNCIITNNAAGNGGYDYQRSHTKGGDGGAIYISSSSSTVIKNSIIKNNKSGNGGTHTSGSESTYGSGIGGDGGRIFCVGNAQIDNSIISLNNSGQGLCPGFGGGAFFTSSSNLTMTGCTISQNKTHDGGWYGGDGGESGGSGGGIWCASQIANFENCEFTDNICGNGHWGDWGDGAGQGGSGGGVSLVSNSQITMNRCTFSGNKTGNGGGGFDNYGKNGGAGGAIYSSADSANFFNCIITGNSTGTGGDISADGQSAYRGGNGGSGAGIYCKTALLANCLITGNITGRGGEAIGWSGNPVLYSGNGGNGGGIYCTSSSIINCTVASNITGQKGTTTQGGVDGIDGRGAIYCDANTIIANSIIWNQSIDQLAGQDSNNIKYCDILDSNFVGTNGNISANPLFANPDANNFHLLSDSPCIDAGDNNSVPADLTTDLDDFSRFYDSPTTADTGNGNATIVDIGAYEFSQSIFNQTRSTYHQTIQQAVDSALAGDKIYISPAIYSGPGNCDIDFGGKDLELRSTGNNTIINCMGTRQNPHRAFKFTNDETSASLIDGFTIINGFGPEEVWESFYSSGGAIYCDDASPTIRNCKFFNNDSNDKGGAICFYDSTSTILNCIFEDNNSECGGAIYNHIGGIDVSTIIVKNCLFNKNSAADKGGVIFNSYANPQIVNCTLFNNQAFTAGGAIGNRNSNPLIKNSIIWNNWAPAGSQISNDSSNPDVQYCDISGGYNGTGNIDTDPYFADTENGDFHLESKYGRWDERMEQWVYDDLTSPCIDAGANQWEMYGDLSNELWPNGKRINMGFYGGTSQASMSPSTQGNIADLNNDDAVDRIDLLIFAQSWLKNENLQPADTNRDSNINLNDFAIFANNWLWQNPIPHE